MKKKYITIICTVLLCVAGLFTYDHNKDNKIAAKDILRHDTRELSMETMEITLAFQSQVLGMTDSKIEAGETENLAVKNTNAPSPTDTSAEQPKDMKDIDQEGNIDVEEMDVPVDMEENAAAEELEMPAGESIKIGEDEYFIVEDEKFSDLINVAKKYDAKLYAIPYTDLFAIIKADGTPIFHMSTGFASAKVDEPDILYDVFASRGEDAEAIAKGIQEVIETGEDVIVGGETDGHPGYSIFLLDDWVGVGW